MSAIRVPISPGELLDKITILRIKACRLQDTAQLANVRTELAALESVWRASEFASCDLDAETNALQEVNERLWTIEDDIRDQERAQSFDSTFIRLARSVYMQNDERAAIKRRINLKLGSVIVEEKSYADYKAKSGDYKAQP